MDIAGIANSLVSSLSMPQLPEISLNNPYVIGLGGLFGMRLVFGLVISLILSLFTGTLSLVVAMVASLVTQAVSLTLSIVNQIGTLLTGLAAVSMRLLPWRPTVVMAISCVAVIFIGLALDQDLPHHRSHGPKREMLVSRAPSEGALLRAGWRPVSFKLSEEVTF